MADKWTYKLERLRMPLFATGNKRTEIIEEVLNRKGLEGWELAGAAHAEKGIYVYLYFKKPF